MHSPQKRPWRFLHGERRYFVHELVGEVAGDAGAAEAAAQFAADVFDRDMGRGQIAGVADMAEDAGQAAEQEHAFLPAHVGFRQIEQVAATPSWPGASAPRSFPDRRESR